MTGFRLHLGDCLDVLRGIDAESVDMALTSPPYDDLRTYGGGWKIDLFATGLCLWRVLRHGGVLVWIAQDQTVDGCKSMTVFKTALTFVERVGFKLFDTMIWDKGFARYPRPNAYGGAFEYMFIFVKGDRPKVANRLRDRVNLWAGASCSGDKRKKDGTLDRRDRLTVNELGYRTNVWQQLPPNPKGEGIFHPAQMPEGLARDHILTWTDPGNVVMDPFTGSGTTGVAALKNGRDFIGAEVNPDYFAIAEKRLRWAAAEQRLPFDIIPRSGPPEGVEK